MAIIGQVTCFAVAQTRRRLVILVALLAAIAVDAASAAPLRMIRDLRAATCCAHDCRHLPGVLCERGCCPATRAMDARRIATPAKHDQSVPVVATAHAIDAIAVASGFESHPSLFVRPGNDPPGGFLLKSSLRL